MDVQLTKQTISTTLFLELQTVLGLWRAYIDTLEDRKTEENKLLISEYKQLVKELGELIE